MEEEIQKLKDRNEILKQKVKIARQEILRHYLGEVSTQQLVEIIPMLDEGL